jgi:hypothetical protein
MKPELQCIAIAEACGWTVINDSLCHITPDRNGEPQIAVIARLPDYLNDLNAMAEAENLVLKSAQQCRDYADFLDDGNGGHFATSAQRAEALLRTVGKWEES